MRSSCTDDGYGKDQSVLTMAVAVLIGETALWRRGYMLYHGVTLGDPGGKRHPLQSKRPSAHTQVIGLLVESKLGRVQWLADVP